MGNKCCGPGMHSDDNVRVGKLKKIDEKKRSHSDDKKKSNISEPSETETAGAIERPSMRTRPSIKDRPSLKERPSMKAFQGRASPRGIIVGERSSSYSKKGGSAYRKAGSSYHRKAMQNGIGNGKHTLVIEEGFDGLD